VTNNLGMFEVGDSLAASWFLFCSQLDFLRPMEKSVHRIYFASSSVRSGRCSHSKTHHYNRNNHALQYLSKHLNDRPRYRSQNPQSSLPPLSSIIHPPSTTPQNPPRLPRLLKKHLEHPERKPQRTKPNSRSSRRRRSSIRVARR
jgi:hypothetical protein